MPERSCEVCVTNASFGAVFVDFLEQLREYKAIASRMPRYKATA
jgi:hypothetical protein